MYGTLCCKILFLGLEKETLHICKNQVRTALGTSPSLLWYKLTSVHLGLFTSPFDSFRITGEANSGHKDDRTFPASGNNQSPKNNFLWESN